MTNDAFVIGSRGSDLALWQSNWVKQQLEQEHPELKVQVEIIQTKGDKILDTALSKIGDKGLFTKALEDRLLDGTIDLAVHSLKDLPTILPSGLTIAAITEREDPHDVFLSKEKRALSEMPEGAHIATGSLRRKSQLLNHRPDFVIHDIRGNVPTRVQKFKDREWDGLVLARAGLKRLEMLDEVTESIDFKIMLPAVGQGALGLETRERDFQVKAIVAPLNDADTYAAAHTERAFLRKMEGGCQVPIGSYGEVIDGELQFRGYVGSIDGQKAVRGKGRGNPDDAETIGLRLANELLKEGAEEILQEVRDAAETNA